ncbi:hypothetical protein A0H81_08507 [Grifola frondosa]|uniref:Uncharacterized protein n=1 Tax=Grifola frondosa TaxID=5627 RepID=A0A1C7M951_GRIFR|nr:hypothetical protein A0H81_08507 [Grifola frondosa]
MVLAAICGLLGFSTTAFSSLARASFIGLYTCYATPIFLRITSGRHKLVPGPFSHDKHYSIICQTIWRRTQQHHDERHPGDRDAPYWRVPLSQAVFVFATGSWVLSARNVLLDRFPTLIRKATTLLKKSSEIGATNAIKADAEA